MNKRNNVYSLIVGLVLFLVDRKPHFPCACTYQETIILRSLTLTVGRWLIPEAIG